MKRIIAILAISLFLFTPVAGFSNQINTMNIKKDINDNSINDFNKHDYPENYNFDVYNVCELTDYNSFSNELPTQVLAKKELGESFSPILPDGLMDSPWPMYCHDTRHTSRSPYSTVNTSSLERWMLYLEWGMRGGIVIAEDETIYYGFFDLYAAYPNGTIKWIYNSGIIESAPAVAEDGTIYFGIESASIKYFHAINPDGTRKWRHELPGSVFSSPAIGDDGTIYFGLECGYPWYGYIYALNPNGTLLWRYETSNVVYSSPAIGDDGTVYCGSHDGCMYALYPNNGTLKWKYNTGYYIRTSPCIGDDGTVYFVSLSNYLYAVYPNNGTLKWLTDVGAGTSPTIGWDGTIYAGYRTLHAVNPTDGSIKWTFSVGGTMRGGTPCNSIDGTIYICTSDGGDIIAINPDGSEKWRRHIGEIECAPAIGKDGTVYVCNYGKSGWVYAFGPLDPNAPTTPIIDGPTSGKIGTQYNYTFKSTSPLNNDVYYLIYWDDGTLENWIGPYPSGEDAKINHTWDIEGTYTIRARSKDTESLWSQWGTLEVTMPLNQQSSQSNLSFQSKGLVLFQFLQQIMNIHY